MNISEHNSSLYEEEFKQKDIYYEVHGDKINKMINLISGKPKRVLDIGCGDGYTGKLIKDKYGSEVHGIDIAPKALKDAKKNGLITKKFDLAKKRWPYKDNYFNLIIAGDIIEHVYDTENFVKECHRILKKRGQLIISTPNINSYQNRFLVLFGKMPLWIDFAPNLRSYKSYKVTGHVRVFNKKTLTKLLKTHGFKVEEIIGAGFRISKKLVPKLSSFTWLSNKVEKLFAKSPKTASLIIIKVRK